MWSAKSRSNDSLADIVGLAGVKLCSNEGSESPCLRFICEKHSLPEKDEPRLGGRMELLQRRWSVRSSQTAGTPWAIAAIMGAVGSGWASL